MIVSIGNRRQGIDKLARTAAGVVANHAQAAVFLSLDTHKAYALTVGDPDYATAVPRNRRHLVGVYTASASVYRMAKWIAADMRAHEDEEMAA